MSTYLLCSTPVHGHVVPMMTIGAELVARGHRVRLLSGSRFQAAAEARGLEFTALRGRADFDDRRVESYLPDRDRYRGLAQAQYDIQTIFVHTIPDQYRVAVEVLEELAPDAVLVDGAFGGLVPLLLDASAARPPILAAGVTPLTQLSRDVAPTGMALPPSASPLGRLRNAALNTLARRVLFRETQRAGERAFAELGAPKPQHFVMDISTAFDRFLQLSAAEFEYPRSDLAGNTVFVGPLPPQPAAVEPPAWWAELDGSRPVVHVTQGTIDNRDLGRLIRPTIEALADGPELVVVSMGGRAAAELGPVPANVRVADYLPYELLLPRTDVMVTNGGFGGVQQALGAGVPLVVAGGTEDKPEVAARVAWSGAGVDLRTGTPSAAQLGAAVSAVLREPRYRARAGALADAFADYDVFGSIEQELARAVAA